MRREKTNKRRVYQWLQITVVIFVAAGLFFGGGLLLWFASLDIPDVDSFHNRRVAESTKIYDRTGDVLLFDVHGNIRRTIVPLEEVSRHVRNAAIAIEDTEFYLHRGIKPDAIVRATLANIREGRFSQGGSTITQQVIKNTVLTNEKTITRKLKEWVLALKIEQQLTKDEILEIYLNETPYGGTIYGVEEASLRFFGKQAKDVSLAEAAYLAALPQAPTYYSPFGNHRDELENRKNLVLQKMRESDFINEDQYREALNEEVTFLTQDDSGIKAPHFVFFVREYLEEKYGVNAVSEQGLRVVTTLDFELQSKAEDIVRRYALENEENFNAENAGMVATDPKTGQILVMVGSRGYFDEDIDGKFNVTLAKRQPGSSFKPFVYASAFEAGYTPETVVFDLQTQFSSSCEPDFFESSGECYSPVNYDDVFRGPMTLRDALAQSVNIPAVKVLYLTGINTALETARRLGITTLEGQNRYGLTLVLGGGEVTLLEMVSSYGVFANEGVRNPHTAVLRVEDADGNVLEEYKQNEDRVMSENVARQISDVLSDNRARTPAFGEFSGLYFPGVDVAAKTGTTNDYRDAWIVGYTPNIAVGSWAGNNDNTAMEKRVAGFVVAPMWNEFMQVAIEAFPKTDFNKPNEIHDSLPAMLRGVWNSTETDGAHSILYSVDKENPIGPPPQNPAQDSQFIYWELPVLFWSGNATSTIQNQGNGQQSSQQTPPLNTTNTFAVIHPAHGSRVSVGKPMTISIAHSQVAQIQTVAYFLNGIHIGSSTNAPFSLTYVPSVPGNFTLRATANSPLGREIAEVNFEVQ